MANATLLQLIFELCPLLCWQVCHLYGEEDRCPGVCPAGGPAGGQIKDGADGVRLPHGPKLSETLNQVQLNCGIIHFPQLWLITNQLISVVLQRL